MISYFFITKRNWTSDKYAFFENKYIYSIVIGAALIVGINYNLDYQLFCHPVEWTYWILIPVFGWLVLFPHLMDITFLKGVNSLLYGLSLVVLYYILLFARGYYLFMLFLVSLVAAPVYLYSKRIKDKKNNFTYDWINFYGITFFAPFYLFFLLVSKFEAFNKVFAIIPLVVVLSFSLYSTIKMNKYEQLVINWELDEHKIAVIKSDPLNAYYLELLLGMHWKYHTRMSITDGWRPPFHDPVIAIRGWLNWLSPLYKPTNLDFRTLKELYEQVFPEKNTEFECKCAKNEVWMN